MAIGPEFIARLVPALDELELRWRTRKISADTVIDFCQRCTQRLGVRPEFEAYRQRVQVTLEAAWAVRESSPAHIRRDVDELVRRWARSSNDNYRDDFEACSALLARTSPGSPQRTRMLAVLASVLDEATRAADESREVHAYLAGVLDRAAWERLAKEPVPPARSRASFAIKKKPAATRRR
jgi:hypothetical protein